MKTRLLEIILALIVFVLAMTYDVPTYAFYFQAGG